MLICVKALYYRVPQAKPEGNGETGPRERQAVKYGCDIKQSPTRVTVAQPHREALQIEEVANRFCPKRDQGRWVIYSLKPICH